MKRAGPVKDTVNFTFEIASKKYGRFTVTAPEIFRRAITARTWFVVKSGTRMPGRDFVVACHRSNKRHTDRSLVLLHRFIWKLAGHPDVAQLDHKDGQPLNNAEDNLRDGTKGNAQNRGVQRNNTSGLKGISWHKVTGKWSADITVGYKRIHLGVFSDKVHAAMAWNSAAAKHHGQFAVLNAV